jgi:hypothetical protein
MGLILTRSPFHISRKGLDANAFLTVEIGRYDVENGDGFYPLQTYSLNFRSNSHIDIAPLINGEMETSYVYNTTTGEYGVGYNNDNMYVRTTLSGSIDGTAQSDVIEEFSATEGYRFFSEKQDEDYSSILSDNCYYAGSSDLIYKLDDSNIRIPLLNPASDYTSNPDPEYMTVSSLFKGNVVHRDYFSYLYENSSQEITKYYDSNLEGSSFKNRVYNDEGLVEGSICLDNFFDEFKTEDIDEILISIGSCVKKIKVITIEECKYNPYRITFKNRFGVMEDLWFFKKSTLSLSVKSEEFRANQFKLRNSDDESLGGLVRSSQEYNKNGIESITLNSGFVDEALNESFKQLMLSEEVGLYDFKNDTLSAIKIKDSELKIKTSTNDKLINYTIEVEMSNNIIDDIV